MAMTLQPLRTWPSEELRVQMPMRVDGARSGYSWVLAEPLPGYPPGTKVSLPSAFVSADADGNNRSALVAIGSMVVRACEVADAELHEWATDRCAWLSYENEEWLGVARETKTDPGGDTVKLAVPQGLTVKPPQCERANSAPQSAARGRFKTCKPPVRKTAFASDSEDEDTLYGEVVPMPTEKGMRARSFTCPNSFATSKVMSPKLRDRLAPAFSAELREYKARVDFLHTILSPSTDLVKYLDTIVMEVMRVLQADRCSLFFVDEVRQELWCIRSLDMEPIRLQWGRGIVGEVAIQGKIIEVADAHSHPSFDPTVEKTTGYTTKSLICLPIKHTMDDNRTIGVIQALNKAGDEAFTEEDSMELFKVSMLICDSFNRHRWHALERGASHGDSGASSLIAHQQGHWACSQDASKGGAFSGGNSFSGRSSVPPMDAPKALDTFQWPESTLRSLNFNALEHSGDELAHLVPMMMEQTGCVEGCGIPVGTLQAWAKAAQRNYRDNPFHNWFHGFGCFQMCYYQIYNSDISSQFRFLDVMGLLAAALCHDLDHPGFTNSYLIQGESELALRYNDISVLENHHASVACELLRGESTRITSGLDEASHRALRKMMIRCILDTDMVHHAEICKQIVALSGGQEDNANASPEESRQLLLSACIHTSDLSGQVMPWPVAKQWEDRVAREFVNQAAAETAAGFTPAPFMQFGLDDVKKRGKLQRDFVDFVLVPLWRPYSDKIPQLHACYDNLVANRAKWNHRLEHGKDAEDTESKMQKYATSG